MNSNPTRAGPSLYGNLSSNLNEATSQRRKVTIGDGGARGR